MASKRSSGLMILVASIAVGAVALGASPREATAEGAAATCGSKENPCPLQKWMKANIGAPMAASDLPGVAEGLTKAASMSPDASWKEWGSISKAGAEAAKKGDVAGTKASCKSCHDKFKDAYKEKFRTKAVP